MKLYTLSTFECQNYTTANWFFATSREKAEKLTEEAFEKVKEAKIKLDRRNLLWEELWKEYNDKSEYKALCKKHNIKDEPYNWNILKIKCKKEYEDYSKSREIMRKSIQKRLVWKMLCKIEYHYSALNREELLYREELLNEGLDSLKSRIIEIDANSILPMVQQNGD